MNIRHRDYESEEVEAWFNYVRNFMKGAKIIREEKETKVRTDTGEIIAFWNHNGHGFIEERRSYDIVGNRC